MTTVTQIITDALRETNIIALGQSPNANEAEEGLRRLQNLVSSVYGNEAGEKLQEMPLGSGNISAPSGFPWYGDTIRSDEFIPLNRKLMLNLGSDVSVRLHPMPDDGARFGVVDVSGNLATNTLTVLGNGRKIAGAASVVLNTNSLIRDYFYRGDLGDWVVVSDLALVDDFPFPEEFDDMFIIMLAMRLNPRFGQSLTPESNAAFNRSRSQFRSRYRQIIQKDVEDGLLKLTNRQSRYTGYGGNTNKFNSGYPY